MRKLTWLLAVVVMSMVAVNAHAAGTTEFGVNGGVLKGTGDFGDATDTGFGFGVFGDYWMNSMFGVGADFGWNSAKLKGGTSDDKTTLMNYGGHAKYMFPMESSPVKAYVVGGLGAYNIKVSVGGSDETTTKFGGRGGLGLEYMMNSQIGFGAEGNFHFISTEGTSTQMITGVAMITWHMTPSSSMKTTTTK